MSELSTEKKRLMAIYEEAKNQGKVDALADGEYLGFGADAIETGEWVVVFMVLRRAIELDNVRVIREAELAGVDYVLEPTMLLVKKVEGEEVLTWHSMGVIKSKRESE